MVTLFLSGRSLFPLILEIYQHSIPVSDMGSTEYNRGLPHFFLSWHIHVLQCCPGIFFFQCFLFRHLERNRNWIFLYLWFWTRTCFLDVFTYQYLLRYLSNVHRHLLKPRGVHLYPCMFISWSPIELLHNLFCLNLTITTLPRKYLSTRSPHLHMQHLMVFSLVRGSIIDVPLHQISHYISSS